MCTLKAFTDSLVPSLTCICEHHSLCWKRAGYLHGTDIFFQSWDCATLRERERASIRPLVGEEEHCLGPSQLSLGDFIATCFLHFLFHWASTGCLSRKHDFPHHCSKLSQFKPYPQKSLITLCIF